MNTSVKEIHFFFNTSRRSKLITPPLGALLNLLSATTHSRLSNRRSLMSDLAEYPFVDWTAKVLFCGVNSAIK